MIRFRGEWTSSIDVPLGGQPNLVLGLVGTVALRGLTESFLFGVEPADPLPVIGAAVVLLAVTGLASFAPARRAGRVDPMEAIRVD